MKKIPLTSFAILVIIALAVLSREMTTINHKNVVPTDNGENILLSSNTVDQNQPIATKSDVEARLNNFGFTLEGGHKVSVK